MPLTASEESGQSSPSLSSGGGTTAAVGVAVGGGASCAGGITGVLTSGFSPAAASTGCRGGRRLLRVRLVRAAGVLHNHDHDGRDHADHEYRYAQRQCPATPVDLRR